MAAKPKTVELEFSLHKYVSAAVEETDDTQAAAKKLEVWALENDALYRAITGPALEHMCYDIVRNKTQMIRRQIWNQDQGGSRVHAHASLLMDFPLIGGKTLRIAMKVDVIEAADFYKAQASDMQFKYLWLLAVAKKLGTKTVEDVFTEEKLRKLQKDLRRE